ncbi:hypothetical protein COS86_03750 [Candidatus Bathyarchaeota archaeon CG07_land_8_20_14_0_80_47_9]|nr:MAG: hypothetical protein COS86_03750 [Candidatus Bathyarchaeota archaeon CG07_land_8_20_14_0_80_47_9]
MQKRAPGVITSTTRQTGELDAEIVTAIATGFLRRIGNKGSLKAKRMSLGESTYTVEVELRKLMAIVRLTPRRMRSDLVRYNPLAKSLLRRFPQKSS